MKVKDLKAALDRGEHRFALKLGPTTTEITTIHVLEIVDGRALVQTRHEPAWMGVASLVPYADAAAEVEQRTAEKTRRRALEDEGDSLASAVAALLGTQTENDPLDHDTRMHLTLTDLRKLVAILERAGLGEAMGLVPR